MVNDGHVCGVIQGSALQNAGRSQQLFKMFVARFRQRHLPLLFIKLKVVTHQLRDEMIQRVVEFRPVFRRAGDDEWRACLVNQDRVHFVDNREVVPALHHLFEMVFHVVAQIVETQLVVGAICNVTGIGCTALVVVQPMHDDARGHAQGRIDFAHPACIALGQIVVHCHDMHALAGKRVKVNRQSGHQCFAFAGFHFRNDAGIQHHAALQLDIKGPQAQGTL